MAVAPALKRRWVRFRNSLLSNPGFQRWAAGFPLTRIAARRNAAALFDVVAGFVYSQILLSCVRLGVLDRMAAGTHSVSDMSSQIGLTPDATERLLKAAASLKLTEAVAPNEYALGPLGAALLGNPSLRVMIEHHAALYRDLADPVALLKGETTGTELRQFWAYDAMRPDQSTEVDAYTGLMAETQAMISREVLDAYSFDGYRQLLDVGGGAGVFAFAVAERCQNLTATVFDLPPVAGRVDQSRCSRVSAVGGDFFSDPFPGNADVVTLVRIIHDHDDGPALHLLKRVYDYLPPGGTLLIAEPLAQAMHAKRVGDAYFGLYLLAMGQGRPRTFDELRSMLKKAGFQRIREHHTRLPLVVGLISAER